MKIFIDDYRIPTDCIKYMHTRIGPMNTIYNDGEWFIVRNYPQFVNAIDRFKGEITHISYDNDLVDEHYEHLLDSQQKWEEYHSTIGHAETGYDCLIYTIKVYKENNLELPKLFFHTMNNLALENMQKLL